MNLPKLLRSKTLSIRLMITFFKIFGLGPFKVTVLPKPFFKKRSRINLSYSFKGKAYNYILSIPIILFLAYKIMTYVSAEDTKYILGKCVIIISTLGAPVILGYYCLKQGTIIEVFTRLFKLEDDLLDNFNRSVPTRSGPIAYEIVVFFVYVSLTSFHAALTFLDDQSLRTSSEIMMILFVEITTNNLIFQYSLIVCYINKRFNYMNNLLLSLGKSDNTKFKREVTFLTSSSHNEMIWKTIVLIRELQRRLYGILKDISKFFAWPILFAVGIFCVRLLLYAFRLVKGFILTPKEVSTMTLINRPVCVLKEMFIIIIMARHMTLTTIEIQKTGEIIFKILEIYSTSGRIQSEIEQFSIEVLHRRAPKSIFRLFVIDGSIVATIVRSTVTYLIILLQFKYTLKTHYEVDSKNHQGSHGFFYNIHRISSDVKD